MKITTLLYQYQNYLASKNLLISISFALVFRKCEDFLLF